MSKLLSTGEMIDRLNVGEIALLDRKHIKGVEDVVYDAVTRDHQGIRWTRSDKEELSDKPLYLNDIVINYVWRIQPNYVSFEVAARALKDGSNIRWNSPDGADSIKFYHREYDHEDALDELTIKDMFEGVWTIEDDNQ